MTSNQYFEVTDWVGRQLRHDKRGAIPAHLDPILERIGGDVDLLSDVSGQYEQAFHRSGRRVEVVGAVSAHTADLP
jgi:hypothetical protein